jgi:hypothetical protein
LPETFFSYFFHVDLSILDKVVSSLYAIFGTPVVGTRRISRVTLPLAAFIAFHNTYFYPGAGNLFVQLGIKKKQHTFSVIKIDREINPVEQVASKLSIMVVANQPVLL